MPIERSMALDVGERRVGIAVSDPLGITVRPVGIVERQDDADAAAEVVTLTKQWEVGRLVAGDPRLPSGDRGPRADMVDAFVARLAEALGTDPDGRPTLPIERWDESYTTETALARLRARGVDVRTAKAREKAQVDAEAAAVILEEWLRAQAGAAPVPPDVADGLARGWPGRDDE